MEVPYQQLKATTLAAIIEEFVTRDGTDYGIDEAPLAVKAAQVRHQLETGECVIVFDTESESCNIIAKKDSFKTDKALSK